MHPDDDLQTTISKWPFILGDVLLVGTALAIAILGDWQLSNWQVVSCVLSVALGAALYVLPYIVEYQVRVHEKAEDRSAELRIVRRQLANTESEVEAIDQRLEALVLQIQKFNKAASEPAVASDEPADGSVGPVGPDHKVSVARPVRAPRERRTVEPRMLQRAIEQKQDSASAAVSRIIDGRSRAAAAEEEADDPGKEGLPQKIEEAVPDLQPAPEAEPAVTADLFADSELPDPIKMRRTKKLDTAVIASLFIGIGNKPYLRGGGGGLNWETGVAMEFEAIGKWRWIAPDNLEAPIELQVYRNDEDPDKKGKHTLEPGQQLEISPEF